MLNTTAVVILAAMIGSPVFAITSDISYDDHQFQGDLIFERDNDDSIGTDASKPAKIWTYDLDVADDLVVDDDALVTGTLTVTEAMTMNGSITLANTKDILVATDTGSDLGTEAASFGAIYGTTLDIDSTSAIGGVMTFAAAPDFASNVPSQVTSRTIWIPAVEFHLDGTTDPGTEVKNNKFTYAFADAAADEDVNISIGIPDDMDEAKDSEVRVVYLCDQAVPTEGEWNLDYLAVGDDDADADLGGALTVLDTSPAQNDWSVTSPMIIPAAAITTSDVFLYMKLYHDVTDPFCGGNDVNVLGVKFTYTSSKNY